MPKAGIGTYDAVVGGRMAEAGGVDPRGVDPRGGVEAWAVGTYEVEKGGEM